MRFKDPIAPRYGQHESKYYDKKFAWLPLTTHDGYGIWLENYYEAVLGAANTTVVSKIKFLAQPITNKKD